MFKLILKFRVRCDFLNGLLVYSSSFVFSIHFVILWTLFAQSEFSMGPQTSTWLTDNRQDAVTAARKLIKLVRMHSGVRTNSMERVEGSRDAQSLFRIKKKTVEFTILLTLVYKNLLEFVLNFKPLSPEFSIILSLANLFLT